MKNTKKNSSIVISGDALISLEEFQPKWREASGFGDDDTVAIFRHFALESDPTDINKITQANVEGIWNMIFFAGQSFNFFFQIKIWQRNIQRILI